LRHYRSFSSSHHAQRQQFRDLDRVQCNFMLVSAFSGTDTMKQGYAHAINSGYRFYSYGDACLLFRGRDQGREFTKA